MISTRFVELRKRRGLMIVAIAMSVGIPGVFVVIRLIMHAAAPKSYGPAGGFDFYRAMTENVLYLFAFIVAVMLGATAGSADLNEGVFRHLVVTGRSRLALTSPESRPGWALLPRSSRSATPSSAPSACTPRRLLSTTPG